MLCYQQLVLLRILKISGWKYSVLKPKEAMIKTDAFYQTNVPGIYAIGDVVPTQALAHVASGGDHLRGKNSPVIILNPLTTAIYHPVLTAGLKFRASV